MLALPLVALTAPSSRVPSKSQQTLLYTGAALNSLNEKPKLFPTTQ